MLTHLDRWTLQAVLERAEHQLRELERRVARCVLCQDAERRNFVAELRRLRDEAVRRDEER